MSRKLVRIDFFADLVCPWCYVGWEALKRAAEARPHLTASVSWRNFMLAPETPPEGYDRREYLAKRYGAEPERVAGAGDALRAAADAAGVPLNLDAATRMPNTLDGHRLVHWAASVGRAEAAIDELFGAYFVEGRDIGQADVLCDAAEKIGLDRAQIADLLKTGAERAEIYTLHEAAVTAGVTGVPVAILNRKAVLMGAETPENYGQAMDRVTA